MNNKYTEFNHLVFIGERVCLRIKNIYFKDTPWFDCYRRVSKGFDKIRKNAKKFFICDNLEQVLIKVSNLPDEDIKILLEGN